MECAKKGGMHIYIYIYRERERERDGGHHRKEETEREGVAAAARGGWASAERIFAKRGGAEMRNGGVRR